MFIPLTLGISSETLDALFPSLCWLDESHCGDINTACSVCGNFVEVCCQTLRCLI